MCGSVAHRRRGNVVACSGSCNSVRSASGTWLRAARWHWAPTRATGDVAALRAGAGLDRRGNAAHDGCARLAAGKKWRVSIAGDESGRARLHPAMALRE
jgi:hypothetical protein